MKDWRLTYVIRDRVAAMPIHPAGYLYLALTAITVLAALALGYPMARGSVEAVRELAEQYEPAPEDMITDLLSDAVRTGRGTLVKSMLRRIEILHGRDSLRVGHIAWIAKVLDGQAPPNEQPPSFRHW